MVVTLLLLKKSVIGSYCVVCSPGQGISVITISVSGSLGDVLTELSESESHDCGQFSPARKAFK